jgi:DNA-directed RNA polymerase subunit RPC12/RpoP
VARLALKVRCTACGHEFDTGIRMDARNLARATFAANYHVCPACGHRGTYGKEDYKTEAPARDAGRIRGA